MRMKTGGVKMRNGIQKGHRIPWKLANKRMKTGGVEMREMEYRKDIAWN